MLKILTYIKRYLEFVNHFICAMFLYTFFFFQTMLYDIMYIIEWSLYNVHHKRDFVERMWSHSAMYYVTFLVNHYSIMFVPIPVNCHTCQGACTCEIHGAWVWLYWQAWLVFSFFPLESRLYKFIFVGWVIKWCSS